MSYESPEAKARNAVIAMVTCLMEGIDEEAWRIARSDDFDTPTALMIFGWWAAGIVDPEQWRTNLIIIANGK